MNAPRYSIVERQGRDKLGEGPVWLAARGEIAWVDILAPAIHRLNLKSGKIVSLFVEESIGWVLPCIRRESVVAGFRSGFWFLDLDTGERLHFGSPEADRPDNRLNDAKVDHLGRIWAGSKDDTDQRASGALYRIDADLSYKRMDDGYQVANGPTFSLDGSIMYHTDSAARTVYAFDIASDGALGPRREWLRFDDAWGFPDGMTTDAEGCIWIAHWDGGALSRFDPEARRIDCIELPTRNITSCAFAGEDLSRLFVTSSAIGQEDDPLAGALFEVKARVNGLAPHRFGG